MADKESDFGGTFSATLGSGTAWITGLTAGAMGAVFAAAIMALWSKDA